MVNTPRVPELTDEQRQALDAGNGVVQGPSYLLLSLDVVLEWFGWNPDELRRELQAGLDDIESGRAAELNVDDFLAEMHQRRSARNG